MAMHVLGWIQRLLLRVEAKICCLFSLAKDITCSRHSQGDKAACQFHSHNSV